MQPSYRPCYSFERNGTDMSLQDNSPFTNTSPVVHEQPQQPAPPAFTPQFDRTVMLINPAGWAPQPVWPLYCLTDTSAKQLASLLSDLKPELFHAAPFAGWRFAGGPYGDGTVPYLRFTDPEGNAHQENAGQLAQWWTHGFNPAFAEAQCRGEIALLLRGQ